jgi:hypothetical protein
MPSPHAGINIHDSAVTRMNKTNAAMITALSEFQGMKFLSKLPARKHSKYDAATRWGVR